MDKKKKTLLLVYNKEFAFFPYIGYSNIEINEVWKKRRFDGCFIIRFLGKIPILYLFFLKFFLGNWAKKVNRYEKIIIFDTPYCVVLGKWLKHFARKTKCYIYLWDGGNRNKLLGKQIFPVYSYNKDDICNGMEYNPLFYSRNIHNQEEKKTEVDVFLCMHGDLPRERDINVYCEWIEKSGVNALFYVIEDDNNQSTKWMFTNHGGEILLDYSEVIEKCKRSKAILEIGHNGEEGAMTLRVLEALFLERKLITTNSRIIEYPFYSEDWIYILNKETMNIDKIKEFIYKPYTKKENAYLQYYDIIAWSERFKN